MTNPLKMLFEHWALHARIVADYVSLSSMYQGRGVLPWVNQRCLAVFGSYGDPDSDNDYGIDPRTQIEILELKRLLAEHQIVELGFGLSLYWGMTWAMIVGFEGCSVEEWGINSPDIEQDVVEQALSNAWWFAQDQFINDPK